MNNPVQLLEKKDWSAPAELILDDSGKVDPGDTLEDGDKSLLDGAVKKREDVQPTGKVINYQLIISQLSVTDRGIRNPGVRKCLGCFYS